MEPLPGLDTSVDMVLRLIKAVYSTKQGGWVWYEEICQTFRNMGYTRTSANHAVFIHTCDNIFSIIILYVDDLMLSSTCLKAMLEDKDFLMKHYLMTDLGEASWILGVQVTRDHDTGWIALLQQKYIEDMLEQYGMLGTCPISTPILPNQHLAKLSSPKVDIKTYQCAMGVLMYPMLATCPDIA